jgi:hypothetical protein
MAECITRAFTMPNITIAILEINRLELAYAVARVMKRSTPQAMAIPSPKTVVRINTATEVPEAPKANNRAAEDQAVQLTLSGGQPP